ncbi:MAG TPA: ATP-binding cassette domain-containing protein [Dermatophilaceae bacterium]|nr:ATP-binding cassette domain-containing protein [Dermatophilaceae bacterium]
MPLRLAGPRILADGVSKTIGRVQLLAPTDLAADPDCAVVVRGPNGAGKTTLLRILAGLTLPTTGTVTIDGQPADERDPTIRERIAVHVGAPTAYRDLTLADHLTLVDATWGRDAATCPDRVAAGLDDLGIGHLHDRLPNELSSGQSQLFRLALVLFRPGDALVLDEPEQRLDPDMRRRVTDLLVARREAGATLVVATHDATLAERVGDAELEVGRVGG